MKPRILLLSTLALAAGCVSPRAGVTPEQRAECLAVVKELESQERFQGVVDLTQGPDEPKVSKLEFPTYPDEARKQGMQGVVVLVGVVEADGVPSYAQVVRSSGSSLLDQSAMRAFRRSIYKPPAVAGRPSRVFVCTMANFRLH